MGISRTESTFPSVPLESLGAFGRCLCRDVTSPPKVLPNCGLFLSLEALKDASRGTDSFAEGVDGTTNFDSPPRREIFNGVFPSFTLVLGPCLPTADIWGSRPRFDVAAEYQREDTNKYRNLILKPTPQTNNVRINIKTTLSSQFCNNDSLSQIWRVYRELENNGSFF